MKIAFVTTMLDYPWGGSEELWSRSAVRLKNEGHDVGAWVPHRPRLSEKVTALAQQGISVRTFPSPPYLASQGRFLWDKFTLGTRRSYAELRRFHPDLVVISQGYNSGGFNWSAVCRKSAIPYVMIVHCNSENWWFEDQSINEAAAAYAAARTVFGVSRGNLDLLRMQLGKPLENSEIVWNPYNVLPENVPAWPVENGRWRMACVARLEVAAKGQEMLLQVLARPEWRARSVELNLFGEGPQKLALQRLAAMLELNQVRFRGYEADVKKIWEQNHLLVLPSRYEGLPLALVEAMWCGRPAVVTDVAGNTEVCVDNETGFVASAPSVSLLADAMQRAWDRREDWQHMGRAARALAESRIPRDPVAVFCERLKRCAGSAGQ